ncbi:MFS family permease [Bacillus pakistanensis]|uniref:MFS family permease n=1 Tax=Rossellomorea pakistanensis TaxID=992288 RepID=A0ABS2NJN3_9BACI|nr:hypothetical protein [Bacillus pakistanensis]MBM7588069.1 MFS family permease [Bacillus pakistanensis]
MGKNELLQLRKHQFLLMNSLMAVGFVLFLLAVYWEASRKTFLLGIVVIFLMQSIAAAKNGTPLVTVFSKKMKKLIEYEHEKLGAEAKARMKMLVVFQSIMALLFFFQWLLVPGNEPFIHSINPLYFIGLYLFMLMILNIGLVIEQRKIDRKSDEELKGYTKQIMLYSIIIGLVLGVMIAALTIYISTN